MPALSDITALVLAGGEGRRMGGVDKGLVSFAGHALVTHAAQRLRAQGGGPLAAIGLNVNRNPEAYQSACPGLPLWPDPWPGQPGPLAGFLAGLEQARTPWLLTVPCDSPRFPLDLARRLAEALRAQPQARWAMASAPEPAPDGVGPVCRPQPVFCLLSTDLAPSLRQFLAQGRRKIDLWTAEHAGVLVPFDTPDDDPLAFANANTPDELRQLPPGLPLP